MKYFLLIALILACCTRSSEAAAVTFVRAAIGTTCPTDTSCATAAFGANTVAGNTIVTCALWSQSSGATNSLSSVSGQGTFTVATSSLVNHGASTHHTNLGSQCAYALNITGGATTAETCTIASSANLRCVAYEITPTATPLNGEMSTATGSTTTVSAGAITTSQNGAFGIVVMVTDDGCGYGVYYGTPGSGWTAGLDSGLGGFVEIGTEYQAQAVAGTLTGNSTSVCAGMWTAAMITFEPPASAAVTQAGAFLPGP